MKEIVSNKALVNTKKVNKDIQLNSQKKSNTPYSFKKEEFEYKLKIDTQCQKIIDILKRMLSNDATKDIPKKDLGKKGNRNQTRRSWIKAEKKDVKKRCTASC